MEKVIELTPPGILKTILGMEDENQICSLTDREWKYLQKELEMSFIVRISTGILVTGEKQRTRRDLSWWTSKKKLESDKYYSNNYMSYVKKVYRQRF
ncbi:hypothetical protein AAHH76_04820 [Bacillus toyonensis]